MPVRSTITPEDDLSFVAHSHVTNDDTVAFSAMPFCATAFSAHAEPLGSAINLNLSEANQRESDSAFHPNSGLSWREWSHYFNLKLLLWVILGHGLLLLLLIFLWRTQSEQLGLSFTTSSANARTETKALKAYFIYAPPTRTAPADSAQDSSVEEPAVSREPITSAPNTVKPMPKPTEQITKPPEVSAQLSKVKASKVTESTASKVTESTAPVPSTSAPNASTPNAPTQSQTQQSAKEAVKPKKAEIQSSSAQAVSTEQSAASGQSGGAAGSVGLFTQRYFERQREQALDDLVLEQANHYSKRSNMSEMSPEMEVLIVPNADDFSGPSSLDLELDPNRIVRKGDTCYRVVKVGTQINPYAENLGFPFDCSGKKMNQEIDDAIKAQLDKMMVKRPKS
ncbi:prolipoprotein diacylglyceryl transferase [Shewanella xiamenensis]|uniref:hypothetical protein n=1 Tax=Shewanella xiamenensis TaxID=332186 RepID=UPI0021C10C89|nr:hypothetical protein [Shewanella xiamenensis]MCT8862881.1 hypothetical protein [Shewanella xiamenensis]